MKTGKIKIPGFYDEVLKPTKTEIDSFLAAGWSPTAFKAAHGLRRLRSADKRDLVENIWAQPTFEVHGFVGGYTGPGVKTAIPPRGADEDFDAPGAEPEAGEDLRAVPQFRAGEEPRRRGDGRTQRWDRTSASSRGRTPRPPSGR